MNKRFFALDSIRGLALLNMIIYHALWDLVYIFEYNIPLFKSNAAFIWQQVICQTFIFISGFCYSFGKHKFKRGLTVFLCGIIISAATFIVMPENLVLFGVLTLLGSCMLFFIPFEKYIEKVNSILGTTISVILFIITFNINYGNIGFAKITFIELPKRWYCNLFTAYIGLPSDNFTSSDYFSIFPWLFLFSAGIFANKYFKENDLLKYLTKPHIKPLEWFGRHSLLIYIVHQPLIYFLLLFI